MVSDVKTVGSLPLERWESSQRGFPTRPLESEVEKSYPCLHWYAISRVGSHLVKSKKDDANFGQEKKREALRDRIRERNLNRMIFLLIGLSVHSFLFCELLRKNAMTKLKLLPKL